MQTVVRMKIDTSPDGATRVYLVVSVNPFSAIQYPRSSAPRASYQVYDTTRATNACALVSEQTYRGDRAERDACLHFDRIHGAAQPVSNGRSSIDAPPVG